MAQYLYLLQDCCGLNVPTRRFWCFQKHTVLHRETWLDVTDRGTVMKLKPADTWFSKCIRHADRYTCQMCGKQFSEDNARGLDCSHHFGRVKKSVRWAKENATSLCMGCHRKWHSHPIEAFKWLEEYMGKGALELLREKANQIVKVTKAEEKEIASHYRKEHQRMVKEGTFDFESYQ